jgi:hypothetical protein
VADPFVDPEADPGISGHETKRSSGLDRLWEANIRLTRLNDASAPKARQVYFGLGESND